MISTRWQSSKICPSYHFSSSKFSWTDLIHIKGRSSPQSHSKKFQFSLIQIRKWNKALFFCAHLHVGLPCRLGRIVDTVCSEGETWYIVTPSLWRLLCRQLWACVLRSWCLELSDRRLPTLWLAPWSGLSIVSPHLQHHGPEVNSDKHFTVRIKLLTKGWRVNVSQQVHLLQHLTDSDNQLLCAYAHMEWICVEYQ